MNWFVLSVIWIDRYLTGNPCVDHEGYRDYVIATLPQLNVSSKWKTKVNCFDDKTCILQRLDGNEISKTERILALQVRSISFCNHRMIKEFFYQIYSEIRQNFEKNRWTRWSICRETSNEKLRHR